MKKLIYLFLSALLLSCASQKNIVEAVPAKYVKSITPEELKKHLVVIASDEMEGRGTGSEGQKKAGRYLINQYKSDKINYPKNAVDYYQQVPAAFMKTARISSLPDSENIWAFIEGTEYPEEIVVVTAHYDHLGVIDGKIHNGADDDGSGTVALLEIAQAFQQAKNEGKGPKRSVLILHVTAEEHGLLGSKFYSEHPLFPLGNTVANINIDMIGRRDTAHPDSNNYIYLIGSDYLSSELHQICEQMNEQYTQLEIDYKYNERNDPNRFYYRSDHYNFAKHGIPSVFLFSGVHADYHAAGDDVEKIEFDALTKRAQLAFAIVWEVANRKTRLVVDKSGK